MPTTTSESRDKLHSKLREVLGPSHAGTLMGMLPPHSEQLATKADIEGLDRRLVGLEQRFDGLDQRMEKFEDRLWDFHEALRAQTRIYITAMVTSMIGVGGLSFAAAALV